jgi:hypothetical protein
VDHRSYRCRKMAVSVVGQSYMSLFMRLAMVTIEGFSFLLSRNFPSDHMHNHVDRDKYIEIRWNNIRPQEYSNFNKVDPTLFGNFGTNYDLYSVMHYDSTAFTWNGQDTIVPRNRRYRRIIGQRSGLSINDVKRINNMYNCKKQESR